MKPYPQYLPDEECVVPHGTHAVVIHSYITFLSMFLEMPCFYNAPAHVCVHCRSRRVS